MTRAFVYGSLLRGEPDHRLLARARFVRSARMPARFTMHDLGAFPAVGPTLEGLDRLVGHPRLYRREAIQLDHATADDEIATSRESRRSVRSIAMPRRPASPQRSMRRERAPPSRAPSAVA